MKKFNTAGPCIPQKHYMADLSKQLGYVRVLVEEGAYFTISRARQYGKTTLLAALAKSMAADYCIISLDFQKFSYACFENESCFCQAFAAEFCDGVSYSFQGMEGSEAYKRLLSVDRQSSVNLRELFCLLLDFCKESPKPAILMVDEVDSATNNQVFLDFLAQLRNSYLDRELKGKAAFQSVILAGLYDIRNIKQKIRGDEDRKFNSPWNIAADFDVDMSLSEAGIAGMLQEYEACRHTGMDISRIAGLLYSYTSGYPFLVSRLCKLMDEKVSGIAWTEEGFQQAVRLVLAEKNPLFDSLTGKLAEYPELDKMLQSLLFTGRDIVYNPDEPSIDMAAMFGLIKRQDGNVVIANRIFETRLYNRYLSASEMQGQVLYKASLQDKGQFIVDGRLNMRRILEKFVEHFHDLYGDSNETFLEEEGRKYFLLYLKPILNGSCNYYIESRTRGLRRTDVIIDCQGEQYIIELKIWRGEEYHNRGERQLIGYLEDYQKNKGYMVSFHFNKKNPMAVQKHSHGIL